MDSRQLLTKPSAVYDIAMPRIRIRKVSEGDMVTRNSEGSPIKSLIDCS